MLNNNRKKKSIIVGVFLLLVFLLFFAKNAYVESKIEKVPYASFVEVLDQGLVTDVYFNKDEPMFRFSNKENSTMTYETDNPRTDTFKVDVLLSSSNTKFHDQNSPPSRNGEYALIALQVVFFAIIIRYLWGMLRGGGKDLEPSKVGKISFDEIAGNNEAKEDMKLLVDFLKHPKKYNESGAELPSGVIFYGSPGTGKTLMAKAIAGEANVPFFSLSGSDFMEMFVGVGAKRVRNLFESARKQSPSIIFIDEIDAIGGNRDSVSNSEHRQTLNALLKELDGFDTNQQVIVIGATNRLEDLDPAFIRPGRFDKHIAIELPEQKDRLDILKLHAKNKKISDDVSLEELSKMTVGMAGADLSSVLNESAILAVQRGGNEITKEDIDNAFFKTVMKGHQKNGDDRDKKELELIAWHEAGHALAAKLLTNNSVPKVTIIPSTSGAGGVTFLTPRKMGLHSKEELLADIKVLFAGRVAEKLLLSDESKVTTGASHDIQVASKKIRDIIVHFGMSDSFGMINPLLVTQNSPDTEKRILNESTNLSNILYRETFWLLDNNILALENIAKELMRKESLSEQELDEIIEKSIEEESEKDSIIEKEGLNMLMGLNNTLPDDDLLM